MRRILASCFTLGMIIASAAGSTCTESVSGETPGGNCLYNESTMRANARTGCQCSGSLFTRECQRTCINSVAVVRSDACVNHCSPEPCPIYLTYECGSCADFQSSCTEAWCSTCQSCL